VRNQKLILFDFDGVIVDGMNEYWHSSLMVCKKYLKSDTLPRTFNIDMKISNTFKEVRPWVKYGWEMVLLTHEIVKKKDPLDDSSKNNFLKKYHESCKEVLTENSWEPKILQSYLDKVRKLQISSDLDKWINLHKPFLEVISFIQTAQANGLKIGIVSTKGSVFTSKILSKFNLFPELIFGYEAGTKVEIISNLIEEYEIIGFIEDRKKTLLNIKKNYKTNKIRCFLADWGYLKRSDRVNLPKEIRLLKLRDLKNILANSD
tara:strand:+ start:7495 stop:8277 length:783 start_codon:yes stop_codon:yes gene_type:complete